MIKYKLMSLKKKKKSELIFFGRTCFEVTISDTSQLQEVGGLLFSVLVVVHKCSSH